MDLRHATLATCAPATGLVVVIEVLRAFTTACFAFEAGAEEIILVSTVEEALALRQQLPGALIMGEVGGYRPEGFDFGNSPSALIGLDLTGRRMIQRTSAGVQGVVLSTGADTTLAASFVCARATVGFIQSLSPDTVTLVPTDNRPGYGDEDNACAEYLEALLLGQKVDADPYLKRVLNARVTSKFREGDVLDFPAGDLDCAVDLNRVNFALRVERRDGLHLMKPVMV